MTSTPEPTSGTGARIWGQGTPGGSIAAALLEARAKISPGDARVLLRHVLGCTTAYLEAHRDDVLPMDAATFFSDLLRRRAAGEPVAYLTGWREFYGRAFVVTPGVLIPRPETELLVEVAIARLRGIPSPLLLELGTGSGCIAITLALELAGAEITANDVSPEALALAGRNAARHGVVIRFLHSDWFEALGDVRYHLIVANPPYIASGDPHLRQGDLRFEPAPALASGSDGLAAIRRIIAGSAQHLLPGGELWFEHGYDQAEAAQKLLEEAGFADIEQHRDLAGILRVSGGRLTMEQSP